MCERVRIEEGFGEGHEYGGFAVAQPQEHFVWCSFGVCLCVGHCWDEGVCFVVYELVRCRVDPSFSPTASVCLATAPFSDEGHTDDLGAATPLRSLGFSAWWTRHK